MNKSKPSISFITRRINFFRQSIYRISHIEHFYDAFVYFGFYIFNEILCVRFIGIGLFILKFIRFHCSLFRSNYELLPLALNSFRHGTRQTNGKHMILTVLLSKRFRISVCLYVYFFLCTFW